MKRAIYPSLEDKKVLITGGGSGIGAGFVKSFLEQKCQVLFIDLNDEISSELIGKYKYDPIYKNCDLTNSNDLIKIFDEIGDFNILINNAARDDRHSLEDLNPDYIDKSLGVSLKHLIICAKYAAKVMKKLNGGVILNLGSISWHLGLEDLVLYETAKAGIEGMTRGLARELGPHNIRVCTIIPGNVKTPRQMKWYTPEQEQELVNAQCIKSRILPENVASLALFLSSDDAMHCTGHGYWIDAGWR